MSPKQIRALTKTLDSRTKNITSSGNDTGNHNLPGSRLACSSWQKQSMPKSGVLRHEPRHRCPNFERKKLSPFRGFSMSFARGAGWAVDSKYLLLYKSAMMSTMTKTPATMMATTTSTVTDDGRMMTRTRKRKRTTLTLTLPPRTTTKTTPTRSRTRALSTAAHAVVPPPPPAPPPPTTTTATATAPTTPPTPTTPPVTTNYSCYYYYYY